MISSSFHSWNSFFNSLVFIGKKNIALQVNRNEIHSCNKQKKWKNNFFSFPFSIRFIAHPLPSIFSYRKQQKQKEKVKKFSRFFSPFLFCLHSKWHVINRKTISIFFSIVKSLIRTRLDMKCNCEQSKKSRQETRMKTLIMMLQKKETKCVQTEEKISFNKINNWLTFIWVVKTWDFESLPRD